MGALVWLGFFVASHDLLNQLSQEQRRAIYVGAFHRPTSKIVVETPDKGWCVKITRVDLDGSTAAVYFQNNCIVHIGNVTVHWELYSPNRTALASGWNFSNNLEGPSDLAPGEQGEAIFQGELFGMGLNAIKTDKRAAFIVFWVWS